MGRRQLHPLKKLTQNSSNLILKSQVEKIVCNRDQSLEVTDKLKLTRNSSQQLVGIEKLEQMLVKI